MGVTVAGGYASTTNAGGGVDLDVNGHGLFAATAGAGAAPTADEHGPSAAKRARAETAPPPSASATVWSQA